MAYPGRTLLACWLVVVLTGTAVGHRHAGVPGHSHGLGWAALPGAPGGDGLPLDHRHYVLLGFELGAIPGAADGGDPAAGARPAVGLLAAETAGPGHAPAVAGAPPRPAAFDAAGLGPAARAVAVPAPFGACPLVSRARTGVLRS